MSLARFEERGAVRWKRLDQLLNLRRKRILGKEVGELPALFRRICQDLALAQHRDYASALIARLNDLALNARNEIYHAQDSRRGRVLALFRATFPRRLRAHWRAFAVSCVLLFGSGLAQFGAVQVWPELAYSVIAADQLESFEEMYRQALHDVEVRGAATDFTMFGFYVQHNIGIAFALYAGGALFGLGAVAYLLFNGIVLGTVFGHLHHLGLGEALDRFAVAHGAFELTGIAVAGAAGLMLAHALWAPGRRTRGEALRVAAEAGFPLIAGAGVMLAFAAGIEAFWSPNPNVDTSTKYGVGLLMWVLVALYLGLAGLGTREANDGPR